MHDKWLNMLPDYIMDTLPDEQKRDLKKHLKGCVDCREALDDWRIIADVTRIKAESLRSPLPPLLDVLDGTNHSHSKQATDEFKGDNPMTTLRIPQQKPYRIPLTAVAVLLLTFFFSLLLLGGFNFQPTPIQQIEGLDISTIQDNPVALFELYIDEVWNKQNLEAIPLLLSENHVHHDASMSEAIVGLEAMTDYVSFEHSILPAVSFSTEGLLANGNEVTGRVTMTYEKFTKTVFVSASIVDGKLVETWFDVGTMVEAYNSDLIYRFFEMIHSGKHLTSEDFSEFEADTYKWYSPMGTVFTSAMTNPDTVRFWNMSNASCKDWQGQHTVIAEGNLVVIQELGTCLFDAPFSWGITLQPTKSTIDNQFTFIMRIEDGKLAELWWYQDDPRFYGVIGTMLANEYPEPGHQQIQAIYKLNSKAAREQIKEQENIAVVKAAHNEIWNSENPDEAVLEPLFIDLYQTHDQKNEMISGQISSPWIAAANLGRAWRKVYPDLQVSIDQISADGDYVTMLMTFAGTYTGTSIEFGLTEPDNKVHQWDGSATFRLEDGKLAEGWLYWDN